jgi:type III secretion system low calcium response chaperone LcrH/SycD
MQYSTETEHMVNNMNDDMGGDFASDDASAWAGLSDGEEAIDVTQVIQEALMKGMNEDDGISEEEISGLLDQIMAGETTLAEIKGLTADALELLYSIAHQFYTAGNYQRASQFFQNLMLLNHWDVRYTFGLAACLQAQKYYEEALNVYSALYFMDAKNPDIFLNAGICRLALGNKEEAEDAFTMAREMARDKAEHKDTFERATGLLEHVKEVKGKGATNKKKAPVAEPAHTQAKKKDAEAE